MPRPRPYTATKLAKALAAIPDADDDQRRLDPDELAVLAAVLKGKPLTRAQTRELAATLRRVLVALPSRGRLAERLWGAAEALEAAARGNPRPRRPRGSQRAPT